MQDGSGNKEAKRRIRLGYEFARLASWRNMLLAALIVLLCLGTLVIVGRLKPATPAMRIAGAPVASPAASPGGSNGGSGAAASAARPGIIPVPAETDQLITDMARQQGIGEEIVTRDGTFSNGNVLMFESCPEYVHYVVLLSEDKRYHVYDMKYVCGHSGSFTPDPYRNVMYKDPLAEAREVAAQLCQDCQQARDYLDRAGKKEAEAAPASGEDKAEPADG